MNNNTNTSKSLAIMVAVSLALVALTIVFAVLHRTCGRDWMLSVYVTTMTFAYHIIMRLAVGEAVTLAYKNRDFNLDSIGFRQWKFEPALYKRLNVKGWKANVITAKPYQFDVRQNTPDRLLHNVAQAELVHRIIMVLSFVPLIFIIPYGVPAVFIITSVGACIIDLQFVVIQRYNRPRVQRYAELAKKKSMKEMKK